MSNITQVPARALVDARNRLALRNEHGQATAEYGIVLLVAVALGMAILMMFTGGVFNGVLSGLLKKVLQIASGMIHS